MRNINDTTVNDRYRVPKPKRIGEVPKYLGEVFGNFFSRLFYIFRLVWETKRSMLFIMIFMAVFNGVMPVIGSIIGARIINRLAEVYAGAQLAFGVIAVLLVLQFVYMFINQAVTRLYATVASVSGEQVTNHVKMKIMEKAREVDMVSFDSPDFYARMENANREAGMRPIMIMSSTFSVLSTLISIVSYIIVLFAVSAWAPWLIILVSIPTTIVNFVYKKKNVNYMFFRSKNRRQMDYYSQTVIDKDLVKEVRMFGLGGTFCDKYRASFDEYYRGLRKLRIEECLYGLAAAAVTSAVYCLLYIFLAKGVYRGEFAVGDFSLYTGAITAIGAGVTSLITNTAGIYEGTLFIDNLISFLDEKPTIVPILDEPRHVKRGEGHTIEFRDVHFRYQGLERDVLKGINLTINEGETVVIVGLNGAGKTTLVKLLTRLYDPSSGTVLLDGHDIREYDVEELYDMFGMIFQDFGKYAVTAGENIVFGDLEREAGPEEMKNAAARSGADQFIEKLKNGYDTPLMRYFEADGAELSIGQWQKLAIARAFYSDSDILILDEPTASLDPMAEQEIFNQFNELRHNKTSIFISHRLSSATIADKILVMEDGMIVECGTHRELMDLKGKYYTLFHTQAARYAEEAEKDPYSAT
ncbi:MAG: ABC transporter ATP-binding protein/permease [Clostridiales bacterium]|nr:ABC transporter ATP-binding protein/permease [Clostridiales bacterium]